MTELRLLTVKQPWATALVEGRKDVENRGPRFGLGYRGPLWIHAGQTWDQDAHDHPALEEAYGAGKLAFRTGFPLGRIIGRVQVVGAHRFEPGCCPSTWAVHADGATHLEVTDAREIRGPVVAGALGIWHARRVHGLEITLRRLERDLERGAPC